MSKTTNKKTSKGYTVSCVVLSVLLAASTAVSLTVMGVIADENKKGNFSFGNDVKATVGYVDNKPYLDKYTSGTEQNSSSDDVTQGTGTGDVTADNSGGSDSQTGPVNTLLDTNKSAAQIIEIYADLMNYTKQSAPGFTKLTYEQFPDGPENRKVIEGEESIDKVFGMVDSLGLIRSKEDAEASPVVHQKGDANMAEFPVMERSKGSYLTDPAAIRSYSYELLPNGNVKMVFVLVDEVNPEPVAENSDVAPSYTGAVFSPMSSKVINETINHPIVRAFATDINYKLVYHDCSVEVEFNPNTFQMVNLVHLANVRLSGSGTVGRDKMVLEYQELNTTLICKDFIY